MTGQTFETQGGGFKDFDFEAHAQRVKLDRLADELTDEFRGYDPYNHFGRKAGSELTYLIFDETNKQKLFWYDKQVRFQLTRQWVIGPFVFMFGRRDK